LPVENLTGFPPLNVGYTPIYKPERLSKYLNLKNLYIKDDGRNPTASFKDRASDLVIKKAVDKGFDTITTASTGNAASSLSGLAASMGLKPIFLFLKSSKSKNSTTSKFWLKSICNKRDI